MLNIDMGMVLQFITDGFIAVDRGWRVVAVNAAAETLLQRSTRELVGEPFEMVVADITVGRAMNELREAAVGRVARRVEHFSPSRYTWFEFQVVPRDDGAYLFMRNITDRARLQQSEAVRASVRTLLSDAPVAISITRGPEHRYELVNALARQLVGGRDIEGMMFRNAFPELADSPLTEVLDEVYRTGAPYTGRDVPVRYDRTGTGTLYDGVFDITYQPLFETDGRISGVLTVAVEVTEYAAMRSQLAGDA